MADINKTIEVIFGAVDNTGSAVRSVSDGITSLDAGIHQITGPLANLGNDVIKAETAIIALGAAMISVSISQAGGFKSSIAEIGTLFGGTDEQIQQFTQDVLAYGQQSGKSFEDITSATYAAVSSGTAYANSLDLLSEAEKLSIAGKADLESSTLALVSTLNAYGESTGQATEYSDILFKTVQLGQTTLPQLAQSLSQATGIAAAAEIPFSTLSAAVAALTVAGVPTAQAMTSIKAAISNIITPAQQATDQAKALGIEFNSTALATQGFDGILRSVIDATGGNVDQIAQLFGSVEALKAVLILGKDAGGQFANALSEMANAAGSTADAYEIMKNSITLVNQNIVNNLRATLITAGLPLLDEYGDAGRALAGVFSTLQFEIGDGAFDPILNAIQAFGDEATSFLEGIAKALPAALDQIDYTGLLTAFEDLGDAVGGLFQGLDLTNADDLAKAIQFVVDAIRGLSNITTGIVEAWDKAVQAGDGFVAKLLDADAATQVNIGNALGLSQIYEQLRGLLNPITAGLNGIGNALNVIAGVFATGQVIANFGLFGTAIKTALGFILGPVGIIVSLATLAAGFLLFSGNANAASDDMARINKLMEEYAAPAANAAKVTAELNTEMDKIVAASDQAGDEFDQQVALASSWDGALVKLNASLAANNQKIDESGKVTSTLQKHTDTALSTTAKLGVTYDEAGNKVTEFGDKLGGISTKFKESGDSAEEATKKSDEYKLKMEELASNERIAVIKGSFELNIAALEADAEKAVAIITSLGDTIASTGEVLTSLFGLLSNPDLGVSAFFDVKRQIDFENEIRKQAADDQSALAQAQVEAYRAQATALTSGTPLFSVNADGVEPELRQLLFKLLQLIQVEASGSYGNFLLALNP